MKEANYAKDKNALIHIALSALIMAGMIYVGIKNGHLSVGRGIFYLAVPASCIWFPDAIATLKEDVISPRTIRIGGWCLMAIMLLFPVFLKSLTS
ncbi:hypothetical protein JIN77_08340 [Verrucomicrobiaceae bacterium R5-34]|uniref:Uncharacterized protein n=1 Tax=Oceaniferula flava TaxID=2800421 RepID=A0AAE2VEL7_9BACT|nr:hypothetical protein [Oceaniferula flavus]MBK1830731.1 hypothetical protein [Verrucomicrobiaceae bacterium R5-34]MBK1855989.1 hypothetical protein [Oceaniferula flavus]MBM1137296.1 hypothetical protein [Oceaniferula flavus]